MALNGRIWNPPLRIYATTCRGGFHIRPRVDASIDPYKMAADIHIILKAPMHRTVHGGFTLSLYIYMQKKLS